MDKSIKDFMIPVADFPQVDHNATLFEAVTALEASRGNLAGRTYQPRAVLITDEAGKVVGKLGLWDCMRALEPKYASIGDFDRLTHFGLNPDFLRDMVEKHGLWTDPLEALCAKAGGMKVGRFMSTPTKDNMIDVEHSLAQAVHQIVMSRHPALYVTSGSEIVGVVRVCDVFEIVEKKMKACHL